jgi:exoribonuclease-2
MNVLFEEDGAFKAATVLSSTESSHQVELASGKRTKIKTSHVLLQFREPSAAQLIERAQAEADTIDLEFLWEAAPQDEFNYLDLARDYFGREPASVEAAALLLRLHAAPVYFYRKGRGRYRPAPPETLRAALAAVERRRRQDELRQQYADALSAGRVPAAIGTKAIELIVRPDRNGLEYKAVEQAAAAKHTSPLRLLLELGAIASPYRWHVDSFYLQHFPRGTGFGPGLPMPVAGSELPLADVAAFSIDDSTTTEIDDAFSVAALDAQRSRIGIHIAAPAISIARGDPIDAVARARMSTVYAPGLKVTMLPAAWIDAYSLGEGRSVPVLSLYAVIDHGTLALLQTETRVERIRIAANLRHDRLDSVITEQAIASADFEAPFATELSLLWRFARTLLAQREAVRGRPEPIGRVDYSFELEGEGEQARVAIKQRTRGSPLDLIVAELMILANSTWGRALAEQRIAGIYRSQALGRVRMSTSPAPHEGIGVAHYAWSTSPLRRYVDLVNQRQIIACTRGTAAPYSANDAELFAIVSGFDAAYGAYAEFQEKMERYWGLRWLAQESVHRIEATVLRGDVLRLAGLPFVTRLPGLPELPRGQRIELGIVGGDTLELTLEARLQQVLAAQEPVSADELELVDSAGSGEAGPAKSEIVAPAGADTAPP